MRNGLRVASFSNYRFGITSSDDCGIHPIGIYFFTYDSLFLFSNKTIVDKRYSSSFRRLHVRALVLIYSFKITDAELRQREHSLHHHSPHIAKPYQSQ